MAPARIDPALRPGLVFMTMHFPDEVDTNVLTIEAIDPKSGTAEFKASAVRVEKIEPLAAGGQLSLMDLHFLDARPTDDERAAVDALLGPPESGWDGGERAGRRARGLRRPGGGPATPAAAAARRCTPSTTASAGSARAR